MKNLLEADLLIRDGPEEADSLDPEAAATWGILTVNLVKAENLVASDSVSCLPPSMYGGGETVCPCRAEHLTLMLS